MQYITFHDWILKNIAEGSNMLEFGSGEGTKLFTEKFRVTSIKHNQKYLGIAKDSNYIYVPIINNWYAKTKLKDLKNIFYDIILIDGPTGLIGRKGLLSNLHLFNFNTIIVVDDLNRNPERLMFDKLLKMLGDPRYEIFTGIDRQFGIIYNHKMKTNE